MATVYHIISGQLLKLCVRDTLLFNNLFYLFVLNCKSWNRRQCDILLYF